MSTVIKRSFRPPLLSEDGRRLAKEHLLAVGIPEKCLKPIVWPQDAVSAYRPHRYAPWEYTTKADILRAKSERKRERRRRHRNLMVSQITHRRRLYVWVFWCPGISSFFEGWWTYIIGCGVEHGGKFSRDSALILRAMELFPVIPPKLFEEDCKQFDEDWQQRERWMKEFARRYQRGHWCGKPQGKALIWAEVQGGIIKKILGRAGEWPKNKGENYGKEKFNAKAS